MDEVKSIPIYEMFHSFQGEGLFSGCNAFFIRTMGCPVGCSWCDSRGTWDKEHYSGHKKLTPDQIVDEAVNSNAKIAIITGGEPAIHDLKELTIKLKAEGIRTHLETSGAYPVKGHFDHIVVSPKWNELPILETLVRANEVKLIIEDQDSFVKWVRTLTEITPNWRESATIFLHPEWTKRNDPEVLKAITEIVKTGYANLRAGWQMHKLFGADKFDPRSMPEVPVVK